MSKEQMRQSEAINEIPDTASGASAESSAVIDCQGVLDPKLLSSCIHCGLCLPSCPTYLATGREMESPRGRLYLMSLLSSGAESLSSRLAEHLESCLGCYGCQTACPSGVDYEKILNQVRPALAAVRPRRTRRLLRFVLQKILPDYKKLRAMGKIIRLWQRTGGPTLLSHVPWLRKSLGYMSQWQSLLPPVPNFVPLPRQAWTSGEKHGQVSMFIGCVMDIFYNHVNHACQRLLMAQRQVVMVPEQTCCGALAAHAGEIDIARQLAKRNIEFFETQSGPVVVTGAGCGAMLKQYGEFFEDEPQWKVRAQEFSGRVVDITEFLSTHKFFSQPQALKPRKVAYHAACHLFHAQKVCTAAGALLKGLEGIELMELEEAEHCCGSAGIFNLTHNELSQKILQRKVDFIKDTGADEVVTTNPGCLLQLETGMKNARLPVRIRHLAELLAEVYCEMESL